MKSSKPSSPVLFIKFIRRLPIITKKFFFQIFRQLELPAELQRIEDLREIVKEQRYQFVLSITNSTEIRRLDNLDRFVSKELEKYEEVF